MTRKLLYNSQTQMLQPWPRADDGEVVGLDAHLIPMTETTLEDQEFDAETHKLEVQRTIDVEAQTVTVQRVAVELTEQEIAERRRSLFPDAEAVDVRDWLLDQGITAADVEAQIALMFPDDQLATAKALNRWEYAVRVPRDHPLVVALGNALGFTQAQLDTEWANVLNR